MPVFLPDADCFGDEGLLGRLGCLKKRCAVRCFSMTLPLSLRQGSRSTASALFFSDKEFLAVVVYRE